MPDDDPKIGQDAGENASPARIAAEPTARPGGGLGGRSAASDPLDRSARGAGGDAPNGPLDLDTPHPEGSPEAIGHEAAQRAAGDAPEGRQGSR